jgi:hypothetical protein
VKGETLGPFQTWLTAATEWEHQGLVTLFFNRIEMVRKVEGGGSRGDGMGGGRGEERRGSEGQG